MATQIDTRFWPALVGGGAYAARSGETIDAINPATGAVLGSFPRCRAEDVDVAAQAAQQAFPAWRATPVLERIAAVERLAAAIEAHADELAHLDVAENGSPIREMRSDAWIGAAIMRSFAGLALELRGETIPGESGRLDYTVPSPFGVVGRIIPFNHPLMDAAGKVAAPLIAGNTVILKPSEHTSLSALRMGELAADVLPPGVLNIVTGYGEEAGDAIVIHPTVRRLTFVGSPEVGLRVQQRAATHVVKTLTMELGGKNPIVVFPDADLALAIEGAIRGMNFTWQGQSCMSTSRLLVHEDIREELVGRLAERMEAMRLGLPDDEATQTGSIVHRRQYEKVLGYLDIGRAEGARVAAGGTAVTDGDLAHGFFVRPTLFDGVRPDSRLAQEEIFGPVLVAMPFSTYEEALAVANGVSYGLTASVYTESLRTAHRFARDVEAGYVWVNDASTHFPGSPFGGWKDSGVGRDGGLHELESFTQIKNVNINFEASGGTSA